MPLAQTLPFMHPSYAVLAVATTLLPLIIHLINRRRYRRVPWAAMAFLVAAGRTATKRIHVQQWLLLLVRMAVVLLLGLAVARPYLPLVPLAALAPRQTLRVLIVDNSCSMNAVDAQGQTTFLRARRAVEELLEAFPPRDPVSLVSMAWPARTMIGHPAYDRGRVRDAVDALSVTQRSTDLAGSLDAAARILGESGISGENVALYVLSDFPANLWEGSAAQAVAPQLRQLATRANVFLVPLGAKDPANVALLNVAALSSVAGPEIPLRLSMTVANYSNRSGRDLSLQLNVGERVARRIPLDPLGPGETREVATSLALEDPSGTVITVSVEAPDDDALGLDDDRRLALDALRAAPVLLVDGARGSNRFAAHAGYLAAVLAPRPVMGAGVFDPRTIDPGDLPFEPLDTYRVVALCNVARLESKEWTRLDRFVRDGGGLIVLPGDALSADHYNRYAFAEGQGLLPGSLGSVQEARDGSLHFVADRPPHTVLADFAADARTGLFAATVSRYQPIRLTEGAQEVALRLSDGAPALVFHALGAGRTAYFATTANMAWTNLPAKGDFVPLIVNTFNYLAAPRSQRLTFTVGDTLSGRLSSARTVGAMRVVTPENSTEAVRVVPENDARAWTFGPVEHAGLYSVREGESRVPYAVNLDPAESDLRAVDLEALRGRLGHGVTVLASPQILKPTVVKSSITEYAGLALVLVLILAIVEAYLASHLGTAR